MTDTMTTTAEATVTLTVNGVTKTFTATVNSDGDPSNAALSALSAARGDAADWTGRPLREALR
ncbi:hypothetical protein ACWT_5834 [Actinoplanes sp. SE50]|uniref:hypothetical protein n=1 Tax=unclassified Actinoplanes TaxID=2626549 RepID=UPI00023EBC25|nr:MULTISPECIES: hypothetical protein [unclassified Actinoplanes]AEV86852.1 hypothetical protein ACPL_5965 [Actinoplanes sp. SE50/110]ATO85249.1 hypothetical protein ACWT_5834 [Actinoplanes sp. SE50]SLM02659.1 hypothetical protein ACSP50_5941 [Actinoplanes sp. SE50/110]